MAQGGGWDKMEMQSRERITRNAERGTEPFLNLRCFWLRKIKSILMMYFVSLQLDRIPSFTRMEGVKELFSFQTNSKCENLLIF